MKRTVRQKRKNRLNEYVYITYVHPHLISKTVF